MKILPHRGERVCEIHGPYSFSGYKVFSKDGANELYCSCPECVREGQVRSVESLNAERQRDEAQRRIAEKHRAGIPPIFMDKGFGHYKPSSDRAYEALKLTYGYARHFPKILARQPASGLLLTGRPGTGKTHLACAIVADVLNQGYTALYARVPKLLIALRESMRMDSYERPSAILDRHISPTLLVLDEYGVNTSSDIDYQWLFTIIDTRYQHNLPTVLISNIDAQKIEEELHERIMERIKGSTGITVTFDWSSERSKGNA